MKLRLPLITAASLATMLALADTSPAQEHPAHGRKPAEAAAGKAVAAAGGEVAKPVGDSTTRHELQVGGRRLDYTATAGTLPLSGAKGEVTAHVFYTAYTSEAGDSDKGGGTRPVTFAFNGGPGAASAFLHLGALGPRVVPFDDKGALALMPVRLTDNPDTWLPFTDLVFVDPVSTGYSRATGGDEEAKEKFYGVEKDAASLTDFIRLYLARSGRPTAPVVLVGESYGGFRVALLAKRLLKAGMDLRGVIMISPAIEFFLVRGDKLMLLPNVMTLPSIAAANAELSGAADLEKIVAEAEVFARSRYLVHLAAGIKDDPEINAELARLTGLSVEHIARHHGRVSVGDFRRSWLRSHDRLLSLYDGAVSIPVPRPAGDHHHTDPILDRATAVLTPAFVSYARAELGYRSDLEYHLLNRGVGGKWDYGTSAARQGFAGALDDLQEARTLRPALKVLIAGGYTDMVTPFAASRFLVDQLDPIEGAAPVEVKTYRGGHMMYLRAPSRQALAADARAMYAAALK